MSTSTTQGHPALYVIDGVTFDLTLSWADVLGVVWRWSHAYTPEGAPLMHAGGDAPPVPLPDVYRDHGPLIPISPRPHLSFTSDLSGDDQ